MSLPQGLLWSSWSSFIHISLLSVHHMNILIYWTKHFFLNLAWAQVSSPGHSWIEPEHLKMWRFQLVQLDLLEAAPYKTEVLYYCSLQPEMWRCLQTRPGLAWIYLTKMLWWFQIHPLCQSAHLAVRAETRSRHRGIEVIPAVSVQFMCARVLSVSFWTLFIWNYFLKTDHTIFDATTTTCLTMINLSEQYYY